MFIINVSFFSKRAFICLDKSTRADQSRRNYEPNTAGTPADHERERMNERTKGAARPNGSVVSSFGAAPNKRTAKGRTGAYMENTEEFKQKLRNRFKEIYNECGNDYQKYVERLEELEKAGKIKTEWLRRDNVKSIWDK